MRYFSVIGLVLLLFLIGCAKPAFFEKESQPKYYKQGYKDDDLDLSEIAEGGVASAGIVVRDGVKLVRTPDLPPENRPFGHAVQAENFSPTLEWKFAERFDQPVILKLRDFDEYVPDHLLSAAWNEVAEGGILAADILEDIHATEPGIRFLLVGRVEQDLVSTDINTAWFMGQQQFNEMGQGTYSPGSANNSRPPTIQRKVGFVLALYDLQNARCVWEDRYMVELHETMDPSDVSEFQGVDVQEKQGGEYSIVKIENHSRTPAFSEALEKGMGKLLNELWDATRPRW